MEIKVGDRMYSPVTYRTGRVTAIYANHVMVLFKGSQESISIGWTAARSWHRPGQ